MANVLGSELNIDGLLEMANKAQQAMDKISTSAEGAGKKISDVFKNISTQGIDATLQKLYDLRSAYSAIANTTVKTDGMKELATNAKNAADEVNKLIEGLTKAYGVQSPTSTSAQNKQEAADVARINELYRDRMTMMKQLSELMKMGLSGKELTANESSQISAIRQRIQVTEQELNQIRQRTNLSQAASNALQRNEIAYTLAVEAETRKQKEIKENTQKEVEKAVEREIEKEKQAELKALSDRIKAYQEYAERVRKLQEAQAKRESRNRSANYNLQMMSGDASYKKAMSYVNRLDSNKGLQSINNMNKAIRLMEDAQNKLNLKTEEGKKKYDELSQRINRVKSNIDAATNAQHKMEQSQRSLINTGDQLQRKLALLFSVSAIQGYVNKLISVRGEFELQQKALSAILQSKDQADKLWNQTVQLAIKSPFTIKELSGYTKQLAAYRIETDKLHDTTKRLADVSAGLGVDMQRIILAYGQVRAAAYLRGTELRQFTEAGIPMLEELARHFTDLEGRAVSVGDVFGRISKRLVSFKDVETVFKKMTSAGGVFFEMQEKQADTLKGMMSNLQDRISIMLNDIGMANEDTLKSMVQLAQSFVQNWREIWAYIKVIVPLFAIWRLSIIGVNMAMKANATTTLWFSKGLTGVRREMARNILLMKKSELAALGMNRAQIFLARGIARVQLALKGAWLALKSFIPLLVVGVVVELAMAFTAASRAAEELNEELAVIAKQVDKELDDAIDKYKKLASAISSATLSYKERNEALESLNREFGEILPKQLLEIEYIKQMTDEYKEATDALKLHYDEKELRLKRDKIEEKYGSDITSNTEDLKKAISNISVPLESNADGTVAKSAGFLTYYKISQQEVSQIIDDLVADIKRGDVAIEDSADLIKKLSNAIGTYLQRESVFLGDSVLVSKNIEELTDLLKNYHQAWDDASYTIGATQEQTKQLEVVRKQRDAYDEITQTVQKLTDTYSNYYNKLKVVRTKELTGQEVTAKEQDALKNMANDILLLYNQLGLKMPSNSFIKEVASDMMSLEAETESVMTKVTDNFIAKMKQLYPAIDGAEYGGNTELKKFEENLLAQINALDDTDFVSTVKDIYLDVIDKFNLPSDIFDQMIPDAKISVDDLSKQLNEKIEYYGTEIKKFQTSLRENIEASGKELGTKQTENVRGYYEEQIQLFEKIIPAYREALSRLGGLDDKGKTDKWAKKIQVLTDAHKTYIKHSDETNYGEAKLRVMVSHAKDVNAAFEDMGLTINDIKFDNLDWIISFLDEQLLKLSETKKEYHTIAKALADFHAERQAWDDEWINKIEKQKIEDAFSQYELGVDISELNLPKDIAKQLFNVDILDLDALKDAIYDIDLTKLGNKYLEFYSESLIKIDELDRKAQLERLKKYSKFLVKAQAERVKIKMDELHQLEDIEKTYVFDEYLAFEKAGASVDAIYNLQQATDDLLLSVEDIVANSDEYLRVFTEAGFSQEQIDAMVQYYQTLQSSASLARSGVQKETQEKLDKEAWESFKASTMYEQLFSDIENLGNKSIEMLITKLGDLKNNLKKLPPNTYKEIQGQITKLEEIQMKRNPFEKYLESLEKVRDLKKQGVTLTDIDASGVTTERKVGGTEDELTEALVSEQAKIESLKEQQVLYSQLKQAQGDENKLKAAGITLTEGQKKLLKMTQGEYDQLILGAKEQEEQARKNAESLGLSLEEYKKLRVANEKAIAHAKAWGEALTGVLDGIDAILDAFGVAEDDTARLWIKNAKQIADMVVQVVILTISLQAMGVAANMALGVIGWIATALQAVALLFSSIFAAHDNALEKQIEELQDKVELLEKSFDKLKKAIDRAYSSTALDDHLDDALVNTQKQIQSYYEMIELEEAKKDRDSEKIEEYRDKIDELREAYQDLKEEVVESLGGSYDIRSTTREFVDAWLDAFRETGSGLDGLKDNFKEFFQNILLEQAVMKGGATIMEGLLTEINNSLADDSKIDSAEYDVIKQKGEITMEQLNEFLNGLLGEGGLFNEFMTDAGDNLSGLQKGIQGITEAQADILAAYLNSLRFYVADSNTKLTQLVDMQTNDSIPNPMLAELKAQTELIRGIRDMFSSVIRSGHPTYGGAFLKVAL